MTIIKTKLHRYPNKYTTSKVYFLDIIALTLSSQSMNPSIDLHPLLTMAIGVSDFNLVREKRKYVYFQTFFIPHIQMSVNLHVMNLSGVTNVRVLFLVLVL